MIERFPFPRDLTRTNGVGWISGYSIVLVRILCMGRDLEPSLGEGKKFTDQIFELHFLGKYLHFNGQNFLFCLVIDSVLSVSTVSNLIYKYITLIYDPFLDQKPQFQN